MRSYWLDRLRTYFGGTRPRACATNDGLGRSSTSSADAYPRFAPDPAATDAPLQSASNRRPDPSLAARPSQQAGQTPLLRFLAPSTLTGPCCIARKNHSRAIPLRRFLIALAVFRLGRPWLVFTQAHRTSGILAGHSPSASFSAAYHIRFGYSHGLVKPAKARRRSWGSYPSQP